MSQTTQSAPRGTGSPHPRPRHDKAAVLQRLATLKRGIMVTTVLGFGTLVALAAQHQVGATATSSTTAQTNAAPAATPTPDNGFFNDQSGSDNQGGSNFGQGTASQGPITGSSVS